MIELIFSLLKDQDLSGFYREIIEDAIDQILQECFA